MIREILSTTDTSVTEVDQAWMCGPSVPADERPHSQLWTLKPIRAEISHTILSGGPDWNSRPDLAIRITKVAPLVPQLCGKKKKKRRGGGRGRGCEKSTEHES